MYQTCVLGYLKSVALLLKSRRVKSGVYLPKVVMKGNRYLV